MIRNEYGRVVSVKIHDLMHDVAQEVGKQEICVIHGDQTLKKVDNILHVRYVGDEYQYEYSLSRTNIRSFVCWDYIKRQVHIDSYWTCLRVLVLTGSRIEQLDETIAKVLLLLRYLDLSDTRVKVLPDSITKLRNLQTLVLKGCLLQEFPKKFCKLVKLRHLDLRDCEALTHMPLGMDRLMNLRVLPKFVVGYKSLAANQSDCELKSLKVLTKIKGDIEILISRNFGYVEKVIDIGEGHLSKMEHLNGITFRFYLSDNYSRHEMLLGNMEPHANLKSFELDEYSGRTIPRWGGAYDNWAIYLPHLVRIQLLNCSRLI